MASVTAENRNGRTLYRLEFRDKDKRRRKIRLGEISKRDAQAIAAKVQSMVSASIAGNDLPNSTAEWLNTIGDDLHSRLAEQGLCKARAQHTLSGWLTQFMAQHCSSVGDYCQRNLESSQKQLEQHFGKERSLKSITADEAKDFRKHLEESGMAQATIATHVKKAKQFFTAAAKAEVITKSPFAGVFAGTQANAERSVYVPAQTIESAIAMAPDAQWRLIIALSRYAGLRCPSETLRLSWADVDFVGNTLTIYCTKTAKQGNSKRIVPILPELRTRLEDAFDPENERCISRYCTTNLNLRKMFLEILTKAKIDPWPRLFHNLRGSLQTDLQDKFPAHVVNAWLGNSERVAQKHYLKVTQEHIATAAKHRVGQGVGHTLAESASLAGNGQKKIPENPKESENANNLMEDRYPRQGSNLWPKL